MKIDSNACQMDYNSSKAKTSSTSNYIDKQNEEKFNSILDINSKPDGNSAKSTPDFDPYNPNDRMYAMSKSASADASEPGEVDWMDDPYGIPDDPETLNGNGAIDPHRGGPETEEGSLWGAIKEKLGELWVAFRENVEATWDFSVSKLESGIQGVLDLGLKFEAFVANINVKYNVKKKTFEFGFNANNKDLKNDKGDPPEDVIINEKDGTIENQDGDKLNGPLIFKDKNGNSHEVTLKNGLAVKEDGRHMDFLGRYRDDQGRFVDDQGRLTNEHSHLIDEKGRLINEQGHLVDNFDRLINEQGHLVDEQDRLVDKHGFLVNDQGLIINENGELFNGNRRLKIGGDEHHILIRNGVIVSDRNRSEEEGGGGEK